MGLCLVSIMLPAQAYTPNFSDDELSEKRASYRAAMKAVKNGRYTIFRRHFEDLDGYVLQNYTLYEYLKRQINNIPPDVLKAFIEQNAHAPVSEQLRQLWLYQLARKKDWKNFNENYVSIARSPKLRCYHLKNLLNTSNDQAAVMKEIQEVWLTGKRLPSICNQVFKAWEEAGHMGVDMIWKRIQLAMERRRISFARQLARKLPRGEKKWMRRWEDMHWRPSRELKNIKYDIDNPVSRMIVKHGIARLAFKDPEVAMERWKELKKKFQFFGEDENYILRIVGLLAAQNHMPEALDWLSAVSASPDDETLLSWRIKTALRYQRWDLVKHFIAALPEKQKSTERWMYWQARVLEQSDKKSQSRRLYRKVSEKRSYYGFMASDRLDKKYNMQHETLKVEAKDLTNMLIRPGIQTAYELYAIGDIVKARRQWNWIIEKMSKKELRVAAVVARHWGWHDRAIYTVTKTDHRDDLNLRFPVLYRDLVEINAERTGIDPSWIYGVMRQESAFVQDARSPAGALGLMQLMPATGRQMGRRLKMRIRSRTSILNVENNLRLGASYLKTVLDRYKGSQVLATASYNAGPHRVKRWLPEYDVMPSDIWVETIPYKETLRYVKNVLSYAAVYDHRLGIEQTPITSRMPDVAPVH